MRTPLEPSEYLQWIGQLYLEKDVIDRMFIRLLEEYNERTKERDEARKLASKYYYLYQGIKSTKN